MNKLFLVGCIAAAAMADDCANFRKVSAGHCADVNFTVADGTVDQKCGPCGTVTFNKFKQASVLSSANDCANFRKVSAGECAEACVPSMVGLCPQSLIVKTGGLDAGHCADVNFTVADGTVDQKCGPCGTVTFNKFKQASVLSSADDCANFRKVSAGECAEACVPSMVGLCPQ